MRPCRPSWSRTRTAARVQARSVRRPASASVRRPEAGRACARPPSRGSRASRPARGPRRRRPGLEKAIHPVGLAHDLHQAEGRVEHERRHDAAPDQVQPAQPIREVSRRPRRSPGTRPPPPASARWPRDRASPASEPRPVRRAGPMAGRLRASAGMVPERINLVCGRRELARNEGGKGTSCNEAQRERQEPEQKERALQDGHAPFSNCCVSLVPTRTKATAATAGRNHQTAPPKQTALPNTSATTAAAMHAVGHQQYSWTQIHVGPRHESRTEGSGRRPVINRLAASASGSVSAGHGPRPAAANMAAGRIHSSTNYSCLRSSR